MRDVALMLLVLGVAMVGAALASVPPLPDAVVGPRGAARRRALARGGLFSVVEPLLRQLGAWLRLVAPGGRGAPATLDAVLVTAGHPWGLCAEEVLALCGAGVLAGASLGPSLGALLGGAGAGAEVAGLGLVAGGLLGGLLPLARLRARAAQRARAVALGLPATLDLVVLCMGAGLDFPSALRAIVAGELPESGASLGSRGEPEGSGAGVEEPLARDDGAAGRGLGALGEELSRLLQQLELGHTRREALQALAERIPEPAVREFVAAAVQAEDKGSALGPVLRAQAEMQRMRRSVAVEEAASRAGVMLMLPLMLLLGCILLLLLGPFLASGMGGFG